MTNQEKKDKRIEFIQTMIYKYTTEEPVLTPEELAFAFLFHCDSTKFLKAIEKEAKSRF